MDQLTNRVLPFWLRIQDDEYGGMYGRVDYQLAADRGADKGAIVTCRALWTFSAAYRLLGTPEYLAYARTLYAFVAGKLIDDRHGGVFWAVNYKGEPAVVDKHIYAQAFAVYGLSEYYRATGEQPALDLANRLFELIEGKGFDHAANAYLEQFDRRWNEAPNEYLSEHGVIAPVTMNTHLHLLEAYTNLYRAAPSIRLRKRLENLLDIFWRRIHDRTNSAFGVFFDRRWGSLLDLQSFGHDIEASWLLDDALGATGIDRPEYRSMVLDAARGVAERGINADGSVASERVAGRWDRTRIWWVQAEAVVGFRNAYQRTGEEPFADLARAAWHYLVEHLVDPRRGGEWFELVLADGTIPRRDVAGPWKCCYHNSRLCMEIIRRAGPRRAT